MKKILYILCLMGLSFSLQSCDEFKKFFSDEPVPTQSTDNTESETIPSNDAVGTATAENTDRNIQLRQLDSLVKVASDSLEVVKNKMAYLKQDLDKLKDEQKDLQDNKIDLKNLFVCLVVFFVILLVVVVVLVKILVKKLSLTDEDVISIIKRKPLQQSQSQVSKKGSPAPNKNEEILQQEIRILKNRVKAIEEKGIIESGVLLTQATTPAKPIVKKLVKEPAKESNVFYMKRTLKENEFDLSLKCLTPNEDTFYRFEVDSRNRSLARFYFDCNSRDGVIWAFSAKAKTLDPVCNVGGECRDGFFQCTTPGEARLEGGKWIVTSKAVVIFS